ncbi:E3 ubiquitin protein ligase DRIP2-like isoform X2 [Carex rostrata]
MPLGRRRRTQRTPASFAASTGNGCSPQPPLSRLVARGKVSVKREVLVTCLTCPLCQGLLCDATTICECLHTFCRKCITKKLVDEEEECCPICKTDLGCSAADKLRPDHHIQYLREKIFPIKRKKPASDKDPQNPVTPIQIQIQKVKERSLSSLVATDAQSKASRRFYLSDESSSPPLSSNAKKKLKLDQLKEEENMGIREGSVMMTYARRQISPDVDGSNSQSQKRERGAKKGLNLIKPENTSPAVKMKTGKIIRSNGKHKLSCKSEERKDNGKRFLKIRRNNVSSRKAKVSAQGLLSSKPIWFSLVASSNPEGGAVLPQLTANFLRIKDGEMNVSSIQKYVKNKLGLGAENEG